MVVRTLAATNLIAANASNDRANDGPKKVLILYSFFIRIKSNSDCLTPLEIEIVCSPEYCLFSTRIPLHLSNCYSRLQVVVIKKL